MTRMVLVFGAVLLLLGACEARQVADAEAGRKVFGKCRACHFVEPGRSGVGPSLHGVVGRKAGTLPHFRYSTAMRNYGVEWNATTLNAFLAAPRQLVEGTNTPFRGLRSETERANVIAYLATLK